MVALICTLVLSAQLASQRVEETARIASCQRSPRELYSSASTAISSGRIEAAIDVLGELLDTYPESSLAQISAFHLAECYLLDQRSEQALQLIVIWLSRLSADMSPSPISAASHQQLQQLLRRILPELPEQPAILKILMELLGENPSEQDSPPRLAPETRQLIALELCRRSVRSDDYALARKWLRWSGELSAESDSIHEPTLRLQFELPVALARHELAEGNPQRATEILSETLGSSRAAISSLVTQQSLAMRFLLAEALLAEGNRERAEEELEWLATYGETHELDEPWLASVALRRAELLVADRRYEQATEVLKFARDRHRNFEHCHEFDYLLARCDIARIEFDSAEDSLKRVIASPQVVGKEALARATWLLGEVYFLQRRTAQASEIYQQVAQMAEFPQWQARGLLQLAKCQELQDQPARALENYRQAVGLSADPHLNQEANRRVSAIQAASGHAIQ